MSELSPAKFRRKLGSEIEALGYRLVRGSTVGARLHLFNKVGDDLILNLAIEGSNFRGGQMTASFYLSVSFTWSYLPEGFPHEAYCRIGEFMTLAERRAFSGNADLSASSVDVWREGYSDDSIDRIVEAIDKTQPRFLNQSGLVEKIRRSPGVLTHISVLRSILNRCSDSEVREPKDFESFARSAIEEVTGRTAPDRLVKLIAVDASRIGYHLGHSWIAATGP